MFPGDVQPMETINHIAVASALPPNQAVVNQASHGARAQHPGGTIRKEQK